MKAKEMLKESTQGRSQNAALVAKWAKLLEGVSNPTTRVNMAKLYENQVSHLKSLTEETRSTNVGEFLKYIFPVLRRVWPNLIANEIVAVQPMNAPIGGIFYYELKYGTTKGGITKGQNLIESFDRFYSSETIEGETVATGDGSDVSFSATLAFTPVKSDVDVCTGGVLVGRGQGAGAVIVEAGSVSGVDDGEGVISGTGVSGTIDYTTGAVTLNFAVAPVNGQAVTMNYVYDSECNSSMPEVNLDLQLCEIKAQTRKLKALWCSEAADDLKAYHGLDAEAELVAGLAAEIALEIDREIVQDIRKYALSSNLETFDATVPSGTNHIDAYRNVITKFTKLSNRIHKLGLRGPANWIVTSPEVSTIIEQLGTHGDFRPIFAPADKENYASAEQPQTFGVYKIGTLQNKWTVYKDVRYQSNEALIGYKGQNFIDAGYVFAPYIPLQITATFLDPDNFQFRKAMRTRYAKKIVRPELYGRVTFTNLP